MAKVEINNELVERAVRTSFTEKELYKNYALLVGKDTLTAGQKRLVKEAFDLVKEAREAAAIHREEIREVAEAEKQQTFIQTIEEYKARIEDFLRSRLGGAWL